MRALVLLGLFLTTLQASAYDNNCNEYFNGYVESKCPGRQLPRDRMRNFDRGSHRMECSGNNDNYLRMPQKYDFALWNDTRQLDPGKAFDMRRELPLIQWSGRIPYSTIEVWRWQECSLGTSGSDCGYETVCEDVDVPKCSGEGEDRECWTEKEEVCNQEPKTCYYDQDRYEAFHCTNEVMNYSAEYVRPSKQEWNKDSHPYAPFLPNKYDLMPGEIEVVQTYNNGMQSPVLRPYVAVGDAWNKYDLSDVSGDGVGAACVPGRTYSIHARIKTIERNTNKASPNAFKMPVDETGRPIDPLQAWIGNEKVVKGKPSAIILDDTSASVVKALAEHSQANASITIAKAETGAIANADALTNKQAVSDGFYKNTVVRIQLVKKNRYWFDRTIGWNVYNDDVKSVMASGNVLAQDQEIALADKWVIDLMHSNTRSNGQGKPMDVYWKELGLQGDRVYAFKVSMYQRGVPFYKQDCETDPRFLCDWFWPIGRSEDSYFSKPMEVRFETNPNWDDRGGIFSLNFMLDGGFGPDNLLRQIFEPLVKEPTTGQNK